MRWPALFVLTALLPVRAADSSQQQNGPPKLVKTPTQLPTPKAEPENGADYLPPAPHETEGASAADIGPGQRPFVRAWQIDDLEQTQLEDNAKMAIHDKMALDKRITVPKIHDVQNDGDRGAGGNHALEFELKYLNWGAVTQEQLRARKGHYFTITWDNDGPPDNFVARFEYREVKSQEVVRTLTQPMPHVSGAVRSYFAVVDRAYQAYGPVVSWRFTVLKGDTVVAEAKSFIW